MKAGLLLDTISSPSARLHQPLLSTASPPVHQTQHTTQESGSHDKT